MVNFNVFDTDGIKSIKDYKYSGSDSSLVLKYILGPIYDFVHKYFVPIWMAPNTITFLGFIIKPVLGTCTISVKPLCLALKRVFVKIVTPFIPKETVISSMVVGKSKYCISGYCIEVFEKCRYI